MKVKTTEEYDVGVIIGRFQVAELHEAHRELIQTVCDSHDKVVIFLGLSPLMVTWENPLDFEARKQMILQAFPQVSVLYINDRYSDEVWSKNLDEQIKDVVTPHQKPVLYGGRDSFISHYQGKYPAIELEPETYVRFSGSEDRNKIASSSTKAHPEFRAGAIWASRSKFATCYPTVDVVITREPGDEMLLAKKPHEDKWRFIGGFADPNSPSYETDVRREVKEEADIEISDPKYVGSTIINDWRYAKERDKIKTLLFQADYMYGTPKPDDDIAELRWFENDEVRKNTSRILMPNHTVLFDMWWENA